MKNYEKALLFAYPALEEIIEAYDAIMLKNALATFSSGKGALREAEALIGKIAEKDLYIYVKIEMDKILEAFTPYERKHFSYKYFGDLPQSAYEGFDTVSRSYFRRQVRLLDKMKRAMNKNGLTEEWFDKTCGETDFFREMLRRIDARERKERAKKAAATA